MSPSDVKNFPAPLSEDDRGRTHQAKTRAVTRIVTPRDSQGSAGASPRPGKFPAQIASVSGCQLIPSPEAGGSSPIHASAARRGCSPRKPRKSPVQWECNSTTPSPRVTTAANTAANPGMSQPDGVGPAAPATLL